MASRTRRLPPDTDSSECRKATGRAFTVEDGLLALRWAEIVRSRGYRLTFSHSFVEADEAIEVFQQPRKRALATIFLGVHWVWIVDRAGRITPHEDVGAALMFLVDLSGEERQAVLAPHTPAWLRRFRPAKLSTQGWLDKLWGVRSKKFILILERIRGSGRRQRRNRA